jgi:dolichol-phosphate mannosyltransferase
MKIIGKKIISVVIPAYKCKKKIKNTVSSIPKWVAYVVVVDDCCPENSGSAAKEAGRPNLIVLRNPVNLGVGGAVQVGYKKALELGSDIVVKMDGDGQMDPAYLGKLVEPLLNNHADYAKGNRFTDFVALRKMPKVRLFGNSALSFIVKASSGYWNRMDPTNGYIAITRDALLNLEIDKISKRFFFEIDMLISLNIENAVVVDVPIPARYEDENSSLKISRILFGFPGRILRGTLRRLLLKYYVYDFNMASVYLLIGVPLFSFGIIFALYRWIVGILQHTENNTGTIVLAVLPIALGVQFLLQAIQIDIDSVPKRRK